MENENGKAPRVDSNSQSQTGGMKVNELQFKLMPFHCLLCGCPAEISQIKQTKLFSLSLFRNIYIYIYLLVRRHISLYFVYSANYCHRLV